MAILLHHVAERRQIFMKDNILLALSALKANKLRSLLTMLGIIIGIASVIAINTIGDSMMSYINNTMNSMGASNISIYLTQRKNDDSVNVSNISPSSADLISKEMLSYIYENNQSTINYIALTESNGSTLMEHNKEKYQLSIQGVNHDQRYIDNLTLTHGRFIQNEETRKVCVISQEIADTFYSGMDPLGQTILLTINGQKIPFYICGVFQQDSNSAALTYLLNGIHSSNVYIPIEVSKQLSSQPEGYHSLTIVPKLGVSTNELMDSLNNQFNRFYANNQNFMIETLSMETMLNSMNEMMATMQIAIACIAAISLLVGGIGVMNIMLVSITERTREIGTRVALGAKSYDIRLQFIVESIIICLIGGLIGIILGILLASIGTNVLGFAVKPSITSCVSAVLFSMIIGVFFGYYPANKAAKLNPIDALRFE